jgi:hypothetical protein
MHGDFDTRCRTLSPPSPSSSSEMCLTSMPSNRSSVRFSTADTHAGGGLGASMTARALTSSAASKLFSWLHCASVWLYIDSHQACR